MASLTFTIAGSVSTLITVTEVGGDLVFNVQLTSQTGTVGDLRALFFDVNNEALLSGLSVDGTDVTDSAFQANTIKTLGGDANINGQIINEFGAFDVGVEIGTAGISANDIRSTQFILSHSTLNLTLDLISQQDFGVRITSVGADGGIRTDSLKIGGEATTVVNPGLFSEGNDTIDFNTVVAGTYVAGTQYDALDGDDYIILPANAVEAAEAGFAPGTVFHLGGGNNTIIGGSLNDRILTGTGNDTIDGGGGFDILSYQLIEGSVTVNLSTGTASGAGGNDVISNIEQVGGTRFDDFITGDDGAINVLGGGTGNDTISGRGGTDVIIGGLGDDIIDGGDGLDRIEYSESGTGVTIDLSLGIASGGHGNDQISNVEQAFGSHFADAMTGDSGDNSFYGLRGNDHLIGGAGSDALHGDAEIHRTDLVSNDIIEGGLGNDYLSGGFGDDVFVFRTGWNVDTIADFGDGVDVIDLRTMGFTDVSQLSINQVGLHTEIDFGGGDRLLLENTTAALFANSDFIFF